MNSLALIIAVCIAAIMLVVAICLDITKLNSRLDRLASRVKSLENENIALIHMYENLKRELKKHAD